MEQSIHIDTFEPVSHVNCSEKTFSIHICKKLAINKQALSYFSIKKLKGIDSDRQVDSLLN